MRKYKRRVKSNYILVNFLGMQEDQDKLNIGDEEEVFGSGALVDDVIDAFDDGDHPIEDDELAAAHHEDDEEDGLFDFFNGADEFEEKDGMY